MSSTKPAYAELLEFVQRVAAQSIEDEMSGSPDEEGFLIEAASAYENHVKGARAILAGDLTSAEAPDFKSQESERA